MNNMLSQLKVTNDELISTLRKQHKLDIEQIPKYKPAKPFQRRITLEVLKDPKYVEAANNYITQLIKHKSYYGYLYFLMSQNLRIKLDVRFHGEWAIECYRYEQIVTKLNELTKKWARENTLLYEVTRVELMYFFILVLNPELNWITVDYYLQGAKSHAHLMAAPSRLLRNRVNRVNECIYPL